jgi:hypothetical protein
MPFTFSHPALVLPLKYLPDRYYSLTGLIIGSMTPDFEYFFRMSVGSLYSHTFWGLFYFDIPVGILLSFIFHDIVRNDLINHLPVSLRARFWYLKSFDWNKAFKSNWQIIIPSIFVGAASHILWDDFTHPLGYFVTRSSFLRHKISVVGFRLPFYYILQNLSTLIGGLIVCLYIRFSPKSKIPTVNHKDKYWQYVLLIIIAVMSIRFLCGLTLIKYGNVIVSLISAFFISIILVSLFFRRRPKRT